MDRVGYYKLIAVIRSFGLTMILLLSSFASASVAQDRYISDDDIVRAVVAASCKSDLVLLGENGFHGEARSLEAKQRIVMQLIGKCGFSMVVFESSFYDFLSIEANARKGIVAPTGAVRLAIGQKWNRYQELGELPESLEALVNKHEVVVAGMDDQLGIRGMPFSLTELASEVGKLIKGGMATQCYQLISDRINGSEYNEAQLNSSRPKVTACLDLAEAGLTGRSSIARGFSSTDYRAMIGNIRRWIAREGLDERARIASRDRSMFLNIHWLLARYGGRRTIIWSENSHVAKAVPPSYSTSLGSLIHRKLDTNSYVLGFSSPTGSYRYTQHSTRRIDAAPVGSIELKAISPGRSGFVDSRQLRRLGVIRSGLFSHQYVYLPLYKYFDGLVVFDSEHETTPIS